MNESTEDLDLLIHEFMRGRKGNLSETQEQTLKFYRDELKRNYNLRGRTRTFVEEMVTQNCSDMFVFIEFEYKYAKHNVAASNHHNDFGLCCAIEPYLEFFNNETKVCFF